MFRKKHRVKHRIKNWQIGSSKTKIDRRYRAKKPGKRKSKRGKTYYEHRKNRSDRGRFI